MSKNSTELGVKRARSFLKKNDLLNALKTFEDLRDRFPGNEGIAHETNQLKARLGSVAISPTGAIIKDLQKQLEARRFREVASLVEMLLKRYPFASDLWWILGFTAQQLGLMDEAEKAYDNVILLKPDHVDTVLALSNVLRDLGKIEKAEKVLRKAIGIKPDFHEAYTNLGIVLQEIGAAKCDIVQTYRQAIAINSRDVLAHQNLSTLVKYEAGDPQIAMVESLIADPLLGEEEKVHLYFVLARMKTGLEDLRAAVDFYKKAGAARQKLQNYQFERDENVFTIIKHTAQSIFKNALDLTTENVTPIFVLGMPRSGTTLIEQIISSHSKVHGADELKLLGEYGSDITLGTKEPSQSILRDLKSAYLDDLLKIGSGKPYVVDKMPQNFLQIALICSALPHAKIIHVKRDAAATCWSNFTQNFVGRSLGYSNALTTVVGYYKLYEDLMAFWKGMFGARIYDLDYDSLTSSTEQHTRNLIDFLGLKWEPVCLSPQNNKRRVKTASSEQVRQKIYAGSSQQWKKFEPYLDGAFDGL